MNIGDQVRLGNGSRQNNWWTVRAQDENFTILTRQAPFREKGDVEYTILDRARDLRGPCNLIGQGWDFDQETVQEDAERLLLALTGGVDTLDDETLPDDERIFVPDVEVSYRNNVPLVVLEVRTP